jgi:pilus assembly protein Flp/PilA
MFRYIRTAMDEAKDTGASAVEYALMVAAIAAVIVGVVFGLGTVISNTFNQSCSSITSHSTTSTDCAGATPVVKSTTGG